jgi:hypothetical protein
MFIVLVGFAIRGWLPTLLLASPPMRRGQPYMYPMCNTAVDGAKVAAIDSINLYKTV